METTNKSILKVSGRIVKSLAITFFYDDSSNVSVTVCEDDLVDIQYVKGCKMIEATGKIKKIENCSDTYRDMFSLNHDSVIILDCSSNFESDVRRIGINDIRNIDFISSGSEEIPDDDTEA